MKKEKSGELDALLEQENAKEQNMLKGLLTDAKAFYSGPKNQRAFRAWKKNKEEITDGTNYVNA